MENTKSQASCGGCQMSEEAEIIANDRNIGQVMEKYSSISEGYKLMSCKNVGAWQHLHEQKGEQSSLVLWLVFLVSPIFEEQPNEDCKALSVQGVKLTTKITMKKNRLLSFNLTF